LRARREVLGQSGSLKARKAALEASSEEVKPFEKGDEWGFRLVAVLA
jgi:hypothetical protein